MIARDLSPLFGFSSYAIATSSRTAHWKMVASSLRLEQ
jgi:hypothetical protein